MIEINPISPSYPIKKPKKVIPERKKQSDQNQSLFDEKDVNDDHTNEPPEPHIDEIV